MKSKHLPDNIKLGTCAKCGTSHTTGQEYCENCTVPQSRPEFLAGLITITLAVVALYFIFQL